ncbi:hypothetical protein AB1Y20_015706 [Prymnesium parvum]|uniref:Secreted protein n=1 Tax=Prymnesium parvum TaxID=97485 RepID=A0AB34K1K3_PRYPA
MLLAFLLTAAATAPREVMEHIHLSSRLKTPGVHTLRLLSAERSIGTSDDDHTLHNRTNASNISSHPGENEDPDAHVSFWVVVCGQYHAPRQRVASDRAWPLIVTAHSLHKPLCASCMTLGAPCIMHPHSTRASL